MQQMSKKRKLPIHGLQTFFKCHSSSPETAITIPHSGVHYPIMNAASVIKQLKGLDNAERLTVIEAATELIRQDLQHRTGEHAAHERLVSAAMALKDLYEPGGDLTDWTALEG